ncbi:hypothetical protein PILCRDRAFT_821184 [Piloderma croceum F 1598]|uniref:Uncharacterized protein n=1 Tax=Piloderma croceum (strain F 1598) TaxID=765440 RepID=A0A0C3B6G7_PILCF|nr:hypothetical protein PILCRDRAFT_821184 [Piloderma croceum F 1598]
MTNVIPQEKVYGASLLGLIVYAPLYGITCGQIYMYYTKYSGNDRWSTKSIVALIWALESIHLALVATMIYHYTITSWEDVSRLNRTTWTLEVQFVITLSVAFIIQLFFARFIWRYSKNWILTGIIVLLSLLQLGAFVFVQFFWFKRANYNCRI